MHLRVAAAVVKVAQNHDSDVTVKCNGCPGANACSILELISLGASCGTHIEVIANGSDENAVIEALVEVFEQGSGI